MKYVIGAAPELTKNMYGLPALDPVRSKSREPVLSLVQVCLYFQQEALHEVILRILISNFWLGNSTWKKGARLKPSPP